MTLHFKWWNQSGTSNKEWQAFLSHHLHSLHYINLPAACQRKLNVYYVTLQAFVESISVDERISFSSLPLWTRLPLVAHERQKVEIGSRREKKGREEGAWRYEGAKKKTKKQVQEWIEMWATFLHGHWLAKLMSCLKYHSFIYPTSDKFSSLFFGDQSASS